MLEETTTTRNRQDLTKTISPDQRRLDSLAKLLASHSECVAVSVLGEKIYITANELFDGTQKGNNKNYAAIKEIMSYFQRIANDESIEKEERENIFVKICSNARFKESYPEGMAKEIAKDVLEGTGITLTIDDIYSKYKENVAIASRMYGEFAKLRKHFLKLEQVCSSPSEELKYLKNIFSTEFTILTQEASSGIHAEVQLLAEAIKSEAIKSNDFLKQNNKIYIGISKLCCLHCRCMLETANKALKEKGVEFTFRGKHDLDFSANWLPPSIFEKGYNSVRSNPRPARHDTSTVEENTLGFSIGKNSKKLIDKLSDEMKPKGISMDASESSSEEGGKTEATICKQKAFLESNLQLIASMGTEDLVSTRKLISIALRMHNEDTFLHLSKISKSITDAEKTNCLAAIMGMLNSSVSESEEKVTLEQIIQVIKNPKLVGDSLAEAFKEYTPDLTKQSHEKNLRKHDRLPEEDFGGKEVKQSLNPKESENEEQPDSKDKEKHKKQESDQLKLREHLPKRPKIG